MYFTFNIDFKFYEFFNVLLRILFFIFFNTLKKSKNATIETESKAHKKCLKIIQNFGHK